MSKEKLYLEVMQDVVDRLNAAVEKYDENKDAEQLRTAIITILKGEKK